MNTEELNASATTLAPEEAGTAMLVAIAAVGAEMSPVTTSYSAILQLYSVMFGVPAFFVPFDVEKPVGVTENVEVIAEASYIAEAP